MYITYLVYNNTTLRYYSYLLPEDTHNKVLKSKILRDCNKLQPLFFKIMQKLFKLRLYPADVSIL